jgi:hypothetical protein
MPGIKKSEAEMPKGNFSYNLKIALENCACLGRQALIPGPNEMTSTYVERMHTMLMNMLKEETKS